MARPPRNAYHVRTLGLVVPQTKWRDAPTFFYCIGLLFTIPLDSAKNTSSTKVYKGLKRGSIPLQLHGAYVCILMTVITPSLHERRKEEQKR